MWYSRAACTRPCISAFSFAVKSASRLPLAVMNEPCQGLPLLSTGRGTGTGDDRVLDVGAAHDRGDRRVVLQGVLGDADRGLLEQLGDHRRQHLDVAHLLGADAEDHVAVLARDVHVPRLELVLQRDGDLAVLAAEHLLELARVDRVGLVGRGRELELLLVEVQIVLLSRRCGSRGTGTSRTCRAGAMVGAGGWVPVRSVQITRQDDRTRRSSPSVQCVDPRTSPYPSVRCAVSHVVADGFMTSFDEALVCPRPYAWPHSCVATPRMSKRPARHTVVVLHSWPVE